MTIRQLTQGLKRVKTELRESKTRSKDLGEELDLYLIKICDMEDEHEQRERDYLDQLQTQNNRIEELKALLAEFCVCETGSTCKACESTNDLDQEEPTFSFRWYQREAKRTAASTSTGEALCATGLGVAGEAGEVADYIKKVLLHGHELDKDKLVGELGDVLWYIALGASTIGIELHEVDARNIEKLRKRYPNGFSTEASINRSPEE